MLSWLLSTAFPPAPILSFGHVAPTQSAYQFDPFQLQDRREVNQRLLPTLHPLLRIQHAFVPSPFIPYTFGASQQVSPKRESGHIFDLFLQPAQLLGDQTNHEGYC